MPIAPASRTIPDLLDEMADRFPNREALVGSGQRYTYLQLRDEVWLVARGLAALGVNKGDKVAILMENRPEWIVADFAICSLGAVMVGVNTWATARELEYILNHSDATLLITSGRFLGYDYLSMLAGMEPRSERLRLLREVILLADHDEPGYRAYRDLYRLAGQIPASALDSARKTIAKDNVAYLLYTSGSTSTPKGVQLQHCALIENMWNIGERQHVTEDDRLWLAVSLFWGLGCENALFNLLTHGGCVVLQEHFDPGKALEIIERESCTMFYGTPNMAQALFEHPERLKHDISSLRGGATIGTPGQIMCVVHLGARDVCNIYGLTETYGNCCVTDASDPLELRLRSVGKALAGVALRIVNPETEGQCPAGEVGEVRVKGYVTVGYYKDPESTRLAIDGEGYFKTGDLGLVDEAGNLFFRGRIKEMVKTGGINVAPVEVEEILMQHPGVHLAFCTGVPDPVRDEVLAAIIVPKLGVTLTEAELATFCRQSLAAYKLPRLYRMATEKELPLTTTGKLKKNQLANLFFPERVAATSGN